MDKLRSIAGLMYALGWISGILAVIYRVLLYGGKVGPIGHILPYNVLQLCVVAFLIAIASDARVVVSTRER